jgi:hypothetical protein
MAGPPCPICEWTTDSANVVSDGHVYDCPRCGSYILTGTAEVTLPNKLRQNTKARAVISHAVRTMMMRRTMYEPVTLRDDFLAAILKNERLPTPSQQADNLVMWLGDTQPTYSERVKVSEPALGAIIGTADVGPSKPFDGLKFVLRNVEERGLLERSGAQDQNYRLLFPGWQRYEELKAQTTTSRAAFMAMSFSNADVETAYTACFQPRSRRRGSSFALSTTRQKQD